MSTDDDFLAQAAADAEAEARDAPVEDVAALVQRQLALEDTLAALEQQVKDVQQELLRVAERQLPDAMLGARVKSWTADDNSKVTLETVYYPSVAKADMVAFTEWLVEQERAGIVQPSLSIELGKGDWTEAVRLRDHVQKITNRKVVLTPDIHWATFRAFAREFAEQQAKASPDERVTPPRSYHVHQVTRAKIKRSKQ